MNPCKVIRALAADRSRLGKEAILEREARDKNNILFYGIRYALDPMMTYGVKQVPEKTGDGPGLSWDAFAKTLQLLLDRKLTGNVAKEEIASMMNLATEDEWNNWYRLILTKDLRCGVSEKTVNKAVKAINGPDKYLIPIFSCQLAQDSSDQQSKMTGEKILEVKLDGVRVLTFVFPNGKVTQYSKNGKELDNFRKIREQFVSISQYLSEAWVFDGEVMSANFQDLMKQIHRKDNIQTDDAVLHLFDMIPMEDFVAGASSLTQEIRSKSLELWFEEFESMVPNMKIFSNVLVNLNTVAGRDEFRALNEKAIEGGYEGIVIKDPSAPYECKRTSSWLKLKPYLDLSLQVVEVEEGTGKNVGSLGAIICEGTENGKEIRVNVGTGFSDEERAEIWSSRQDVIGFVAEVRCDSVTQNQDGTYSLRFPRFLRWRGFNKGEEI